MKKLGEMTKQELDNKLILRWGLITIILLACTILQSSLATALCDSFEPIGSCPETNYPLRPSVTNYTNMANKSGDTVDSVVNFTYRENVYPFTNITYTWKNAANGTCWSAISGNLHSNSCLRGRIDAINKSAYIVGIGGYSFNFDFPTNHTKWSYELTLRTNSWGFNGTHLWVINSFADGGESTTINFTIWIEGKTLFATMTSPKVYTNLVSIDRVTSAPGLQDLYFFEIGNHSAASMYDQQGFYIVNRSVFFNTGFIYDKSDHSRFYTGTFSRSNISFITDPRTFAYNNLTNGSRNHLNTTVYWIISQDIHDVFLNIPHDQNFMYDELKTDWFIESWFPPTSFDLRDEYNKSLRFSRYGMNMADAIVLSHIYMSRADNMNWSSLNFQYNYPFVTGYVSNITSLSNGLRHGMYTNFQDIFTYSVFYNGSYPIGHTNVSLTYNGRFVNATNHSMISRDWDGSLQNGYVGTVYHGRFCRRPDMLEFSVGNQTSIGQNIMYIDTDGATTQDEDYIDYDFNDTQRGRQRMNIYCLEQLYNEIEALGLPSIIEDLSPTLTAGLSTAGVGNKKYAITDGEAFEMGLFPDYEVSMITEKELRTWGYPRRVFKDWADSTSKKYGALTTDESSLDRYITMSVAERKLLRLDNTDVEFHNFPDNISILMYYSGYKVGQLLYSSPITNITYGERNYTTEEALILNYSFYNAFIHTTYSNGLHVYSNFNQTPHWVNITINGAERDIPNNGFYAYMEDGSFEEFYNDANLSHWVYAKNSFAYFYPKGTSVTFNLPEDDYTFYEFFSDSSSNGKRVVASRQDITSYTTSNPTYVEFTNTEFACVNGVSQGTSGLNSSLAVLALVIIMVILARWLTNGMTLIELSLWTTGIIVMSIYAIIMMGIGSICT